MKLFSKRHNLYNDEAAKRRRGREVVGGVIMAVLVAVFTWALLNTVYIESVRQARYNMGPVK